MRERANPHASRVQEDEVEGTNERCLPTSSFDAKTSRSKAERAFDCHILVPYTVIQADGFMMV